MVYHSHHTGTGAGYQGGDHGAVDYTMLDPDKGENAGYDANKDYQANKDEDRIKSGYQENDTKNEEHKKEESKGIDKRIEDESKPKYEKKEADSEDLKKAAASEIHNEISKKRDEVHKKKAVKSIEDAINQAVKKEKEILRLD